MYKFYYVIAASDDYKIAKKNKVKRVLYSYFYIKQKPRLFEKILEEPWQIIIDSGVYSFNNKAPSEEEIKKYCDDYIEFVKDFSSKNNIENFFELDFDLMGYDYKTFVKPYQDKLLNITDKIILVNQIGRTEEDLQEMLQHKNNIIAIPCANNKVRSKFDYDRLINIIHKANKKVHLLGCSKLNYLKMADQSDSSTWIMSSVFGRKIKIVDEITTIKSNEKKIEIADNNCKEFKKLEKLVEKHKKFKQITIYDLN